MKRVPRILSERPSRVFRSLTLGCKTQPLEVWQQEGEQDSEGTRDSLKTRGKERERNNKQYSLSSFSLATTETDSKKRESRKNTFSFTLLSFQEKRAHDKEQFRASFGGSHIEGKLSSSSFLTQPTSLSCLSSMFPAVITLVSVYSTFLLQKREESPASRFFTMFFEWEPKRKFFLHSLPHFLSFLFSSSSSPRK